MGQAIGISLRARLGWRLWRQMILLAVLVLLLLGVERALALDSARSIDQFRHTRWTLGDGAPGNIRAIVQGRDGFLWLGTSTGLYRFDGIRFERLQPEDDDPVRSLQVTALLAARNGDIWVGYDFGGIGLLHAGRLRSANPWPPRGGVESLTEGRDGAVWVVADSKGKMLLSRFLNGRWTKFGPAQGVPEGPIGSLLAASDGTVYVASPLGVLRLKPGDARFEGLAAKAGAFSALAADTSGRIWLADETGLRPLDGRHPTIPLTPIDTPGLQRHMIFDRDGMLWIAAQNDGLVRYATGGPGAGKPALFSAAQGLTAPIALSVLEDREGNIWVGTESGLDRFSPSNVVQPKQIEGLVTGFVADPKSGQVFFAGLSGVYRAHRAAEQPQLIFRQSAIGVLCGDARQLLVISLKGTYLLTLGTDGAVEKTAEIAGPLSVTCALDDAGTFWTGMDRVYRLEGTHLVPATGPAAAQSGTVTLLRPDGAGGLIAARSLQGFQRIRGASASILWRTQQGSIGAINTLVRAGSALLLGGQKGLARYDGRRLASLSQRSYPFLAGITGIHQTDDGWTWLIGALGIVRVPTRELDAAFLHPGAPLDAQRFGYEDGYRARSTFLKTHDIAEDGSGRLWFATNRGLAWIDRDRIGLNRLAPNVVILALTSGDIRRTPADGVIHLPVGTNRVQIDYTALSLTDAAANRYRYRLEGADRSWIEAGHERQALYTNLGPGSYRFQVVASNNDGVWNRQGAVMTFVIAPAFYQTGWFFASCLLAAAVLLWLLYRWRLKTIANRTRHRLEAQMAERERIARELHDTLLQGFQGLMLRFQSVVEELPAGNGARDSLENALERADDVLLEGRERVRALREDIEPVALPKLFASLAQPIVHGSIRWRILEEGESCLVCAPVADDMARIVGEAVSNAVRHAQAQELEIGIRYTSEKLVVSIIDDGVGIPRPIREAGRRDGHYGLIGMRERANRLGATLEFLSRKPKGTEVKLSVPARVACP